MPISEVCVVLNNKLYLKSRDLRAVLELGRYSTNISDVWFLVIWFDAFRFISLWNTAACVANDQLCGSWSPIVSGCIMTLIASIFSLLQVSCGKCGTGLGHEFVKGGPDGLSSRFWIFSHSLKFVAKGKTLSMKNIPCWHYPLPPHHLNNIYLGMIIQTKFNHRFIHPSVLFDKINDFMQINYLVEELL